MRTLATGILCWALLLAGCTNPREATPSEPTPPAAAEGPHSPTDRKLTPLSVRTSADGSAEIAEVDLGDTSVASFSTPIRGLIVAPTQLSASRPAPVVILSHLRAPNCSDISFAFPCPAETEELRFDHGWEYLATALAHEGYISVIPDLGPAYVGAELTQPYSQKDLWSQTVSSLLTAVGSDHAGSNELGLNLKGAVDLSTIALVAHSRSAVLVDAAISAVAPHTLGSIVTYGGSYNTFDPAALSPPPPDIPYLGIEGELDNDVEHAPSQWLGNYLDIKRSQPAAIVQLPGFGHMGINTTAITAGLDDRTGCDITDCASDTDQQRIFTEVVTDWLAATILNRDSQLPIQPDSPLPSELAGLPVRWLAHTPKALLQLDPHSFQAITNQQAEICRHGDLMNPAATGNNCPEPHQGVIDTVAEVLLTTGARAKVPELTATTIAVHLAPFGGSGSHPDVTLELELANNTTVAVVIPGTDPVVADRSSEHGNGIYGLSTWRAQLPEAAQSSPIVAVTLHSESRPVELRGVDLY